MSNFYFTPSSISFLAQFILSLALTGFLVVRFFWRLEGESHSKLVVCFLFIATIFSGLLFADAVLLPGPRLIAVYLESPVEALAVLVLLQFAYRFPAKYAARKWESRLALALGSAYVLYEIVIAVHYFVDLQQGVVNERLPEANYILALLLLWVPIAFSRQCLIADERPVSWFEKLQNPPSKEARASSNFATLFLILVVLGIANILNTGNLISTTNLNIALSLGILGELWLMAMVYINSLSVATSFLVKLSITTLTLLLSILSSVSWMLTPAHSAAFQPKLTDQQSLRFTPNILGGYGITEIPFSYETDMGEQLQGDSQDSENNYKVEFPFPLYGKNYSEIYITKDGMVKMGTTLHQPNLQADYGRLPGIFPLLVDLQPNSSGGVYVREDQDRMVISWIDMPSTQQPYAIFTFQTILYSDGHFDINYIDLPSALIFNPDLSPLSSLWVRGVTPGTTEPVLLVTDLSQAGQSGPQGILQDFNISFREYLHQFILPLGWMLLTTAVVIFIAILILLNASIIQPLNALLAGVKQVDQGNLDVVIPVQDFNEFGELAQSFNDMVTWLKTLVTGLEQRVVERTAELELTNTRLKDEMSIRQASQAQLVEQQRTLAALDERDRVSRDLHDGLAQVMSSISLQTQAAQTLLAQGHDEAANSSLASVLQLSRDANADIRNFILGLRTPQTSASPDLFSTLVDFLREYGEQSDIQASLSIPSDYSFPALAPAAEEQVLRIIQESLANTRKHAQAHKVEILFSADERSLQVAIMDDGVGFDIHQQQSDELPHFGMNMMRDRVKILGGRLDVRSAPGQGTKILVFIPREIVDAAPVATKNLLDLRLLLVDDSPIFLEGLRNLLSARGLTVIGQAHDGFEAQEKVRQLKPDLVVMDIMMPHCNGIEATRAIKADFPEIKVVMLTTSEKEEHLFDAIKNGASGFLLKGTDANEFCNALEKMAHGETILSPEIATRLITEFSRSGQTSSAISAYADERLSGVQAQILDLVADGNTYKEVGDKLNLSEHTIKYHMKQILDRLQLNNRSEVIEYMKARAKEK